MNKSIIITLIAFLTLVFSTGFVSAQTCMISPGIGHRLLPDTDCDRVVDIQDNCPYITNPLQRDAEGNGLGNACDLVIESIRTNPGDFVYNGRAFNVFVTLQNHRPHNIRNMKVRVFLPELGIESVVYIDNLEPCTSETVEFFLRAPLCSPAYIKSLAIPTPLGAEVFFPSPAEYLIVVEASFINLYSEQEVIPGFTSIQVLPDDKCLSILQNKEVIDNTFINVMEIQDVYKGSEAVFPMKISNNEANDKEYIFSVTGISDWGYSRLEPGSLIIVPSETDKIMDLYVGAYDDIDIIPGERVFVVSVQSEDEVQRFLLIANVKEPDIIDKSFLWFFSFRVILISGLIILLIVAAVIGIKKYMENLKSSENVQYY